MTCDIFSTCCCSAFHFVLFFSGLGGYVLARRALAPMDRMAEQARLITATRMSDRLPVDNPNDELGRLSTVFNDTLARLQSSFDQMRRFTSDASHELRTPLTAIRSVGEVGLSGKRDEGQYREIIGSMLEKPTASPGSWIDCCCSRAQKRAMRT
jgi:signal transduction histidine kinase